MADTTNPVSPDDQTTPDLLGDISLDIPAPAATENALQEGAEVTPSPIATPTPEVDAQVSDLGEIMLEQSVDATQAKAENTPEVSAELETVVAEPVVVTEPEPTPAPMESIVLEVPVAPIAETVEPVAPVELHPVESIPVPEVVEPVEMPVPVEMPASVPTSVPTEAPAPAADPMAIDLGDISAPAAPEATLTPNESASPESSEKRVFKPLDTDVPGPEVPAAAPTSVPAPTEMVIPDLPVAPAVEPIVFETPAPVEPTAPAAEPIISEPVAPAAEAVATPEATTPSESEPASLVETLTNNEQSHITAETTPTAEVAEAPAEVSNDTVLDLDSLTSDIAAATAGNGTTSPTVAESSVTLPAENMAVLKPHSSLKKKVFMSLAGFIVLAVVGVLVAKVMFPLESEKLFTSILGGSETPETPILIDTTVTETPAIVEETPVAVATGAVDTWSTVTEPVATISMDEAEATLTTIADESRKNLALALKTKNKTAEGLLYKTFKDSSALLEELANTSDITTMATLTEDIETLQKDLTYATSLLDETGNNSES